MHIVRLHIAIAAITRHERWTEHKVIMLASPGPPNRQAAQAAAEVECYRTASSRSRCANVSHRLCWTFARPEGGRIEASRVVRRRQRVRYERGALRWALLQEVLAPHHGRGAHPHERLDLLCVAPLHAIQRAWKGRLCKELGVSEWVASTENASEGGASGGQLDMWQRN